MLIISNLITGGGKNFVNDSVIQKRILHAGNEDSLFLKIVESDDFPCIKDKTMNKEERGTRGSLTSSISSFGVTASVYPQNQSYVINPQGNYFFKEQVVPDIPTEYYWPSSSYRLAFYAYYPYGEENFTLTSTASTVGSPTYSYTVPSVISRQVDIMTAQVTDHAGGAQMSLALPFRHRCSAVKVSYTNDSPDAVTVRSITLSGIKHSGTLKDDTWTLSSPTSSFSLTLNRNVAAGSTSDLTGTSDILLMLPQTLPAGAQMTVTMSDGTEYTADISGVTWTAGNTYTYTISVAGSYDFRLNVTGPSEYTHSGGTQSYSIQSYKENAGGVKRNVAWTAQYSTDGGTTWTSTKPSWLTAVTASGAGGTSATTYSAAVAAQTSSTATQSGSDILKAASSVTDYDLSLHDVQGNATGMTTANCYMIHAPGTYRIPLVYGNAIKNGSVNTQSFNPTGTSGTYFLKPFLNHAETGITAPWISKSTGGTGGNKGMGISVNGASLIWQDVNGLIKNGSLSIDGNYLCFEITPDAIAEGNAVIAATKSGTVVWSWHIWVTPERFNNLTTVATGSHTYTVTPVNLGWVATGNVTTTGYAGREVMVKISQSESDGLNRTFTIRQLENITVTPSKGGYNTYYQWGRKDPEIPAANMTSTTDHAAYNISGSSVSKVYSAATVSLGTTIQNPLTHYYNSSNYGPYSTAQYNLWDATKASTGVGTNATVKTIYDPCPPGFCVPTANLYSYFASNSGSATWDGTSGQAGRTWTKDTPNLFFPASGYRLSSSGYLYYVGSYGRCWSASAYSNSYGYHLDFSSRCWTQGSYNRAYGFPVRAVAEE